MRAIREEREQRWRVEDTRRRHRQQERSSEALQSRPLRNLAARWTRDRRLAQFLAAVEERARAESDSDYRARALERVASAHEHLRRRDPLAAFVSDEWPEAELPPPAAMPWNWI
jgi:hypothetical protein